MNESMWRMDPGPASVEVMHKGRIFDGRGGGGWVMRKLLDSGFAINSLRTQDVLPYDVWKKIHDKVKQISLQRMVVAGDIMNAGLTVPLDNAMGTTVFVWQDASDMEDAHMGMDARDRGLGDAVEHTTKYLPLPIVYKRITLNIRVMEASRRNGQGFDVSMVAAATRKVSEYIENMVANGPNSSTFTYAGGVIYGYKNYTYRSTGSLTGTWKTDIIAMKQKAITARHYGPYAVYVPTASEGALDDDYDSTKVGTVRERLLKVDGIQSIKVVDKLTTGNVLLVSLEEESVQMVVGFEPQVVEWDSGDGLTKHFLVMAMMVPWLKADQENRSGVVHYS